MKKTILKRILAAALCLGIVLSGGAAALAWNPAQREGFVAKAEADATYGGLDLSYGIKNASNQPNVDAASNTLIFTFPGISMTDGSKMENNTIDGQTWKNFLYIHSTVERTERAYSVYEWSALLGKSFRFACYGKAFIVQFENNSFANGKEVDYIQFKKGFRLFQGGAAGSDWVFQHVCDTLVEGTEFQEDLTLYINRTAGKYEYKAQSLSLTGAPAKTEYTAGDTFEPGSLALTVQTVDGASKTVPVTSEMYSSAPLTAGMEEIVISYGGMTVSQPITVAEPGKTVESVAADFSLSAKRYSLPSQFEVPQGAKITVTYSDRQTEQVDFTLGMLEVGAETAGVVDTSTSGERSLNFNYTEGGKKVTGTVSLNVSEELAPSAFAGINYGTMGKDSNNNRNLAFKFTEGTHTPIVLNQNLCASLIPGKTIGDLVLVKFVQKSDPISIKELNANLGSCGEGDIFLGDLDKYIPQAEYGSVEYVCFKPGFVLYTYSGDAPGNIPYSSYYPLKNGNAYAYVSADTYLTWTSDERSENFGTVELPVESISVSVSGAMPEFYAGQTLTDADISGYTVTAHYYGGTSSEPFALTAAMCSHVPEGEEGSTVQITVTFSGKQTTFDAKIKETPNVPTAVDVSGVKITAKRYALPTQFVLSDNAKITVTYSKTGTQEIPLTLDKFFELAGITATKAGEIDTSVPGSKNIPIRYTENGTSVEAQLPLTVTEELAPTAITGFAYGGKGMSDVQEGRKLPFTFEKGLSFKVVYGQERYPSLIGGKTNADLILLKFANRDSEVSLKTFDGVARLRIHGEGNVYLVGLDSFVASADYGSIEYIRLLPGLVLYNDKEDSLDDNRTLHELAIFSQDGSKVYAYVTDEIYLTYTSDSKTQSFGTVEKPIKNLKVTAKTPLSFWPEQKLTDADLADVTWTADYVDPRESGKASGTVTAAMCSAVPLQSGAAVLKVRINGAVADLPITVKEVTSFPDRIAINTQADWSIVYKKYAVLPTLKNCELVVTYEDGSTKNVPLTADMIVARPDTTSAGQKEITVRFSEYGRTLETTVMATVSGETTDSNIRGIAYGEDSVKNGFLGVDFSYVPNGADGIKAIDNILGLPSSDPARKLGELVLIKFKGLDREINLLDERINMLQIAFYGGRFTLRDYQKLPAELGEIDYILFKAGFVWYSSTEDTWGNGPKANTAGYFPVSTNIVTSDLYVSFYNGKLVRSIESITVQKPADYKTNYVYGEELSLDFTLLVTYRSAEASKPTEVIHVTREMCGPLTGNASAASATVTYQGYTLTIDGLTYDAEKKIGGLVIEKEGKKQYSFAVEEFDLSGYVIKLIITDLSGKETDRRTVVNADVEIGGFDSHALGKQTVKLHYAEQELTVEVEVVNDAPEKHLVIDYIGNYDSYETTQLEGLAIDFGFTSEVGTVQSQSFLYGAELPNVADKLLINDTPATTLLEEGKIEYIGFFGMVIYIRFGTELLQPTKNPVHYGEYIEGVTELVETVTFLPGFQYYTVDHNIWPGEWTMNDVTPVKHGVVKEKIVLQNVDYGKGWVRKFKQNAAGTGLADDAITVSSLPEKTTFTVGEKVTSDDLRKGLELLFKYEDGGSETYTPGIFDLEFDSSLTKTAGKKTVSVYFKYNDYFTTFEVNVVENNAPAPGDEEPEKKGCGATLSLTAFTAISLGTAAFAIAGRKKKNGKGKRA